MTTKAVSLRFTDDGFGILTMQNGQNRFNISFVRSLNEALDDIERNENCKALISTSIGKFYSNGIDLEWLSQQDDGTIKVFFKDFLNLFWRMMHFPLPTVAALNGHTFAGGAFFAMCHDYRIMRSDRGWISWNEIHIKMRFGDQLLELLSTKIPDVIAVRETALFGKRITGPRARELGLVDSVTEEPNLLSTAKEYALDSLGKDGLDREMLKIMKQDLYPRKELKSSL